MLGNKYKKKKTINMLMNIDNYFGEHEGRLAPILLFLLTSAIPFIIYTVTIATIFPLKYALVIELIWTIRMALFFIGGENPKLDQYRAEKESAYVAANDLVRVAHIHDSGLIEYVNNKVVFILTGYCMTYMDDDAFSIDLQDFISQLRGYDYDILCPEVVNEFRLQDNIGKTKIYSDKELMKERMQFYIEQDEYCEKYSQLYKINIAVKANKYDWKKVEHHLQEILASESAKVFKEIHICSADEVEDVMSRDICANINLHKMMVAKYRNEDYDKSQVLYYGDNIPEELKPKRDKVELAKRRVILKDTDNA